MAESQVQAINTASTSLNFIKDRYALVYSRDESGQQTVSKFTQFNVLDNDVVLDNVIRYIVEPENN